MRCNCFAFKHRNFPICKILCLTLCLYTNFKSFITALRLYLTTLVKIVHLNRLLVVYKSFKISLAQSFRFKSFSGCLQVSNKEDGRKCPALNVLMLDSRPSSNKYEENFERIYWINTVFRLLSQAFILMSILNFIRQQR